MATVVADKAAATVTERAIHAGVTSVVSTWTVPATGDGTAAGDVIQMVKVPKGAVILSVDLACTDLDTGGPTGSMDVGDGDDVDRFIDGTTIMQAGGIARLGSGVVAADIDGALGYTYPADDTIDVLVVAAATTKAAGVLVLAVTYALEA